MQSSDRPRRLPIPFANGAGAGFRRTVPTAPQSGGAASLTDGFPPLNFDPVASGGVPPFGQDVNGILYDATGAARWAAAGGIASYDASYASAIGGYPLGAVLASSTIGRLWQSTAENNTADPDSDPTNWVALTASFGPATGSYVDFPNGKRMQWGIINYTSTGEPVVPVALPVAFANAFYSLSITGVTADASTLRDIVPQIIRSGKTTTTFSVQYQRIGAPDTSRLDGFEWQAIGYAPGAPGADSAGESSPSFGGGGGGGGFPEP